MIGILKEAEKKKKATGGKPNKLRMEEKSLMVLEYLREYEHTFMLLLDMGYQKAVVSESSCYRNIKWIEDIR